MRNTGLEHFICAHLYFSHIFTLKWKFSDEHSGWYKLHQYFPSLNCQALRNQSMGVGERLPDPSSSPSPFPSSSLLPDSASNTLTALPGNVQQGLVWPVVSVTRALYSGFLISITCLCLEKGFAVILCQGMS